MLCAQRAAKPVDGADRARLSAVPYRVVVGALFELPHLISSSCSRMAQAPAFKTTGSVMEACNHD